MEWFYVYVLYSRRDYQLYTGYTNNLGRRIDEHNQGRVISTKNRTPLILVYSEACLNQSDAVAREKYLKAGMGKKFLKNRLRNYFEIL